MMNVQYYKSRHVVSVPPDPPVLSVVSAEVDSLHLKWVDKVQRDIPILGKFLFLCLKIIVGGGGLYSLNNYCGHFSSQLVKQSFTTFRELKSDSVLR
jgi:hypothetical protein